MSKEELIKWITENYEEGLEVSARMIKPGKSFDLPDMRPPYPGYIPSPWPIFTVQEPARIELTISGYTKRKP